MRRQLNDLASQDIHDLRLERVFGVPPLRREVLSSGYINRTYGIYMESGSYILKVYGDVPGEVRLNGKLRSQAEYDALRCCEFLDLAAPKAVARLDNAIVMRPVDGRCMTDLPLHSAPLKSVVNWLIGLHSAPTDAWRARMNRNIVLDLAQLRLQEIMDADDLPEAAGLSRILGPLGRFLSDHTVPSHGDAGLQNFFLDRRGAIAAIDFEFCGIGNPAFDVGNLVASILIRGGFAEQSFRRASECLAAYRQYRPLQEGDMKVGLLCSLILDAAAAPKNFRTFILRNCPRTITIIE